MRTQSSFLTHDQLDLVLMGSLMSTVNDSDKGVGQNSAKRQWITVNYMHRGYHLCRAIYSFLHGISRHRIQSIKQHILEHGLVTRTHGNIRKSPHHALMFQMIVNKRDNVKILPCSDSKKVYNNNQHFASYMYIVILHFISTALV